MAYMHQIRFKLVTNFFINYSEEKNRTPNQRTPNQRTRFKFK